MTTVIGHWSKYALKETIHAAGFDRSTIWTVLDMRLYGTNSNPDSGPTPDEITVAGYAPQPVTALTYNDVLFTFDNTHEIDWAPISSTSVAGVAITDTAGHILWYAQLNSFIVTTSDGGIILPPHYFTVKLLGV